ncbi:MAG TPA: BamA/TamA family outer membrane protein [Longimicrobiales bacterium]
MWPPLLALAIAVQAPDTIRPPLDPATINSAYVDATARELVRLARARRDRVDRSVRRYEAIVRERISAGIRALRRERLLYRRELAFKVDWRREGTIRVEALGAREVIPIALPGVRLPDDRHLGFDPQHALDPAEHSIMIGFGDSAQTSHPLAPGSEADYRFRAGDTTTIRLPDGSTIRLLELEVIPRRRDWNLLRGSFWLDADSHSVVRAVLRPAREFDLERDADEEATRDIPLLLRPFIMPIEADIEYITIEYGLWEMRWWMPRLVALEGFARVGPLLRVPFRYELAYSDYSVYGDDDGLPPFPEISTALAGDTLGIRPRCRSCICVHGRCRRYEITVPADTSALLRSEYLPPSPFEQGEALLSEADIHALENELRELPLPPWQLEPPRVYWGLGRGLLRYNRIEGLSVGARAEVGFGRLSADATARIGLGDLVPNFDFGVSRAAPRARYRLAAYRRLLPVESGSRALGLGNSLTAFLFGRDDADYYRALGVELTGAPAETGTQWYEWRLFAERQSAAAVETQFSIAHLLDGDQRFRPNLRADDAELVGAALALRVQRGLDPTGFRWAAELELEAAAGTHEFVRPSLTTRIGAPLPGALVGSLEAAAGTILGDAPAQRRWFLGGPATVRGYAASTGTGDTFWRARAEIGTAFPGARVALFGDAGWVGTGSRPEAEPNLAAVGVGVSSLDGLIRLDLARALRTPTGWRLHLYVDAML